MTASLDDVVSVLRAGNQNMSQLIQAVGNAFPITAVLSVANGGTGQTSLTANGVLYGNGTSGVGATAAGAANSVLTGTGGAPAFSSSPTLDALTFAAGTVSRAPLTFTSGTNKTTAAAGTMEYDGTCLYGTSVASSRQVMTAAQFATVQGSDVSLSNSSTSAQAIFASGNDVLQLAASTTYQFDSLIVIATGTTSHTTAFGLAASSALTAIRYVSQLWSTTAGTISTTAASVRDVTTSNATVLNAASTAALTTIRLQGLLRTNGAATITPQVTFSAGPTGTCAVKTESYFRIWPLGSSSVAAVGNWS